MDWLGRLTGETRGRLLRLVRASTSSIADLASALGISENAVRGHVAGLERDGLVRQAGVQRETGGKPARLYELTPEAEELFPKAYSAVFAELLRTLREEDGEEALVERLGRVGRRLGEQARAAAAAGGTAGGRGGGRGGVTVATRGRVEAAAAVLESLGGAAEVLDREGGWTIRSAGCPLSGLVTVDPRVCALAEALVAEVSGLPVTEACDRGGRPRCAFHVREE